MSTNEAAERLRRMFSTPEGEALNKAMPWTLNETLDAALAAERSAGAAPLDVEVLAMAIRLSFGKWREFTPPTADMKMANTAAAEYARLSKGTDR
jgi:hypothetical protein